MGADTAAMAKPVNGFKTMLDTIIAPTEAFEALRIKPTWVIAFITVIVCFIVGTLLSREAAQHAGVAAVQHMIAPGGLMANSSDLAKQQALENAQHPPSWQMILNIVFAVIGIAISFVFNALFMWIANAAGKGDRGFGTYFAASANIAVPSQGLAQLAIGIIARIRGADAYNSTLDLYRSLPGLGMLHLPGYVGAALTAISVFSLWGLVLSAMMLRTTGHVKGAPVWIFPTLVLVIGALFVGCLGIFG